MVPNLELLGDAGCFPIASLGFSVPGSAVSNVTYTFFFQLVGVAGIIFSLLVLMAFKRNHCYFNVMS